MVEFTSCLLDPLKTNTEARHAFGDSLDYLVDAGIKLEQKKVIFSLCLVPSSVKQRIQYDLQNG